MAKGPMIYLDNAATSYPKPERVIRAVEHCLRERCGNPGRGAYRLALEAGRVLFETRELLARLFGVRESANIVFTLNCTEATNLALKGVLEPGDHVVTTSMEHNAVARPLRALEPSGVVTTKVACAPDGSLAVEDVERAIRSDTKLLVVIAASNVSGTLMPLAELGDVARRRGLVFMVDAAQMVGHMPLDVGAFGIHLLAFPGHKALLGPTGVGGLYIDPQLDLRELMQGGTGGSSESLDQPTVRPDRYESGTQNVAGIAGLAEGVKLLLEEGVAGVAAREAALTDRLLAGLEEMPEVAAYGPARGVPRAPVVSLNVRGLGCDQVAFMLDQSFGIAARSGLHCAADAHRTLGTIDTGAVRLSIGYSNTGADIDTALEAVASIAREYARA